MESVWDVTFIVVDVETNGSNPAKDRLTEIACVTVKGGEIVNEYSSLINPCQFIPPFITKITGITNEMAFSAPSFKEIAPELEAVFNQKDAVFVAHNSKFDWSFVQHTFMREGYCMPTMRNLCTLKLARRMLNPNLKKNVGALADYYGIGMKGRHRALDDAKATAHILIELLDLAEQEFNVETISDLISFQNRQIRKSKTAVKAIAKLEDKLTQLPDQPGVYYYKDKNDNILYIGKAKSLKDRVKSYFSHESLNSIKIIDMLKRAADIHWTCVESELEALLLESKEIKKHKPPFNVMSKRYRNYPFIKITNNTAFPKVEKSVNMDDPTAEYYGPFRSGFLVEEILKLIEKKFMLRECDGAISASKSNKPCFYYQIGRCGSPCSETMSKEEYDEEVQKVKTFLSGFSGGIIKQLEDQMFLYSDELQFEQANIIKQQIGELRKLLDRMENVPTAVNDNNLIYIKTNNSREKTVDLMLIKQGKLAETHTIGRKAPLQNIFDSIHEIYYNGNPNKDVFSREEIDEIRITTGWLFRNKQNGRIIYVTGKEEPELKKLMEKEVRNFEIPDTYLN